MVHFQNISEEYFEKIPILERVDFFLSSMEDSGLRLTQNGNLPTKVVKSIVSVRPDEIPPYSKRFIEAEFPKATLTKNIAKTAKLFYKRNNRLFLNKKGREYLKLPKKEQYQLLFEVLFDYLARRHLIDLEILATLFLQSISFFQKNQKKFYDAYYLIEQILLSDELLSSLYAKVKEEDRSHLFAFKVFLKSITFETMLFEFGLVEKKEIDFQTCYCRSALFEKLPDVDRYEIVLLDKEGLARFKDIPNFVRRFFEYVAVQITRQSPTFENGEERIFYESLVYSLEYMMNSSNLETMLELIDIWHKELIRSLMAQELSTIKKSVAHIEAIVLETLKGRESLLSQEGFDAYMELRNSLKIVRKITKLRTKEKRAVEYFLHNALFVLLFLLGIEEEE